MRIATTAFAIVVGASISVLLAWRGSEWALQEFVWNNTAFNIRQIDIQTDGIIPLEQIRMVAGVKEGDNLLALDLSRIKRDLELLPLIESASVERVLPNALKLRIVEREPIAQISGFDARSSGEEIVATTFYLDRAGFVMLPWTVSNRPASAGVHWEPLPVLTGIIGAELRPGKRVESPQMHAALQLVAAFSCSPMVGLVDLKAIDLSAAQTLVLTTGQGNEITFSLDKIETQLRRWRSVHDYARQEQKGIASLDLSVANNVPVRWQEATSAPVPPPKPVKPSRYRKKHV